MKEIKLKQKKQNKISIKKISSLFEDKKKRYINMLLFMLPFIIAIGIFGFVAYKEAKSLINLAKDDVETKDTHKIESMNYILRDNATELQEEYFTELKNAIENPTEEITDEVIAGLVGKNYVADFYTWTNKQGQYDVGGMYYVCSEKNETVKYKENIYQKARDGFYKYINEYIDEYGSENLLEVASVEVISSKKLDDKYSLYEFIEAIQTGDEAWDVIYDYVDHDAYAVSLRWTYNENTKLNLSDYAKSINLIVIENDGRYEIVEASEKTIDIKDYVEIEEETETEESESESESDSE